MPVGPDFTAQTQISPIQNPAHTTDLRLTTPVPQQILKVSIILFLPIHWERVLRPSLTRSFRQVFLQRSSQTGFFLDVQFRNPILCKGGGSEGGGESEELINGDDSPNDENSKDGAIIEPLSSHMASAPKSSGGDDFMREQILTTPMQLSENQNDLLQDADLDADVQQKLLSEIPFKVEDKEEIELKEEPESITTISIPYADSTTSQHEHVPYLSKQFLQICFEIAC